MLKPLFKETLGLAAGPLVCILLAHQKFNLLGQESAYGCSTASCQNPRLLQCLTTQTYRYILFGCLHIHVEYV